MKTDDHINIPESQLTILCLLLAALIFILDSLIPLGVAGGVPYILVVLVSVRSTRPRLAYYVAIGTSILTIAGFFSSPYGGELWKVLSNRALALFAIWVTAVLSYEWRTAQEENMQAISELNALRGLLPICASCKKIRDEQGSWQRVEDYVERHTDVSFSHGTCPECLQKFFPDEDLDLHEIYNHSSDKRSGADSR